MRALLALSVLAGALAVPAAAAPSVVPDVCDGERATLVDDGRGPVVGTAGSDVIVTRGATVRSRGGDDLVCVVGDSDRITVDGGPGRDRLVLVGGDAIALDLVGEYLSVQDGDDWLFGEVREVEDGTVSAVEVSVTGTGGPNSFDVSACAAYAWTLGGADRVRIDLVDRDGCGARVPVRVRTHSGDDVVRVTGAADNAVLRGGRDDDRLVVVQGGGEAHGGPGVDRCRALSSVSCER